MSLLDKASIVWPEGAPSKAGNLAAWNPQTSQLVEFDVVRATTKTYVDEDGLIQTAAANVLPRDFTDGGCGVQKVEPQRTNLAKALSGYNTTNLVKSDPSTNDNQGVAQTQFAVTTSGVQQAFKDVTIACTQETDYVWWAVFESAGTNDVSFALVDDSTTSSVVRYRTDDNSTTAQTGNFSDVTLQDLGNGSYKLSGILTTATGQTTIAPRVRVLALGGGSSVTANGQVMKVSQFQIEEGSYKTSWIPTTETTTVTRNADVPSLSSAAALLGDSEGGIFAEVNLYEEKNTQNISINGGSADAFIIRFRTSGVMRMQLFKDNVSEVLQSTSSSTYAAGTSFKFAARYEENDFSLHVDGSEVASSTSGPAFDDADLTEVEFNNSSSDPFYGDVSQLIVFNQAPTDAQLSAITT